MVHLKASYSLHRDAEPSFSSRLRFIAVCILFLQTQALHAATTEGDRLRVVSRQELLEVMNQKKDYDPTATTNGARFQAEVLLSLARQARARDPEGAPLSVNHEDWFQGFLEVTGRTLESAPTYALMAYRHKQDMKIDYRTDRVIRKVKKGPKPDRAVNVVIGWTKVKGGPTRYSYKDTLSTPHLKVTNRHLITYRLLDCGNMVVYDQIKGLTGRPTSGVLGFLFRIIGEGRVVESRMAISQDGLQVTRTKAKKAFLRVTTSVTVFPDGRTEKDVPADRPDLRALETRIKQELEIEYVPLKLIRDW